MVVYGLLVAAAFWAFPAAAGQGAPAFEEVIASLAAVNAGLRSFQVEQIIDARIWFFSFRLLTTVYAARPARYRVVVHNPPWFLQPVGTVFTHLGRPEDLLVQYLPREIRWVEENGRRLLYLDLVRRLPEVNPPRAEGFVDPDRWLVVGMVLHYEWGDVYAEYTYDLVGGFLLPTVVTVRIPAYRITATARYRNYLLNVPIPDSMFADR